MSSFCVACQMSTTTRYVLAARRAAVNAAPHTPHSPRRTRRPRHAAVASAAVSSSIHTYIHGRTHPELSAKAAAIVAGNGSGGKA